MLPFSFISDLIDQTCEHWAFWIALYLCFLHIFYNIPKRFDSRCPTKHLETLPIWANQRSMKKQTSRGGFLPNQRSLKAKTYQTGPPPIHPSTLLLLVVNIWHSSDLRPVYILTVLLPQIRALPPRRRREEGYNHPRYPYAPTYYLVSITSLTYHSRCRQCSHLPLQKRRPHSRQSAPRTTSHHAQHTLRSIQSTTSLIRWIRTTSTNRWQPDAQGCCHQSMSGHCERFGHIQQGVFEGVGAEEDFEGYGWPQWERKWERVYVKDMGSW